MQLASWFHDDITWCMQKDCPIENCYRNQVNMMDHTGLHSYAMFKGTDECPICRFDEGCMHICLHAKECFSSCDDPDDALKTLMEEYCDKCVLSEMEED